MIRPCFSIPIESNLKTVRKLPMVSVKGLQMDAINYVMKLNHFCLIQMLIPASLLRDMLMSGKLKDLIMIKLRKFFQNGRRKPPNGKNLLLRIATKTSM